MATITYNSVAKQFNVNYAYTDTKGKPRTSSTKPRTLLSLANQIIRAQQRGVAFLTGSATSQDLSGLPEVLTITGAPDIGYTVAIVGFGAETILRGSASDALKEAVRLAKEYPNKDFKKALRKRQVSINFMGPAGSGSGGSGSGNPNPQ